MRILVALWLVASCAIGADFDPVSYYTTNKVEVYWQQFHAAQFPRFADATNKHLLIAVPKATWNSATPTKRNAIISKVAQWLNGTEEVSAARIAEIKATLNDANIGVALTSDPHAQLAAWGLHRRVFTNALETLP